MSRGTDPIRVLHVDDDPAFADLTATALERENGRFEVETATSADDGLDRVDDGIDCVVSDYEMPGQNGIEFLETVRETRADLPFVLFTGKGSEEVASDAISAGVTDYLQKASGTEQYAVLANRITNAVEAYRARERAARRKRINTLIRNVNRHLVEADTVEAIERTVCETITESEPYRFAWIGEPDPDGDEVVPRASAGEAATYLDEVTVRYGDSSGPVGPGGQAVRTREAQVVENLPEDPRFEPWREVAERYGYRSVIVLPLVHDGTLHGILPIYADHPGAFGETEREVLDELAGTISEAIHAAKTRRRLEEREAELARKTRAMDRAPVGITISDPSREDNPLVYANDRFCELTGYDEDEVLGRNCRFLQGPDTDPETVAEIRRAIDAEEPVEVTLRNYRKDGTGFWNRVSIAPVYDDEGELANYAGFQRDVTDRVESGRLESDREPGVELRTD